MNIEMYMFMHFFLTVS